jgi:hypothetical protein
VLGGGGVHGGDTTMVGWLGMTRTRKKGDLNGGDAMMTTKIPPWYGSVSAGARIEGARTARRRG